MLRMIVICCVFDILFVTTSQELLSTIDARVGHLQPIGNQKAVKRGDIEELDFMPPSPAFYREYWIPQKPVVFRGVLKHTRAIKNWINDTYMRHKFGSTIGLVDRRTTWSRGGVESPPRSVMNYSEFLDRLPKEQVYWDDQIPNGHQILRDVPIPFSLNCEELRRTFIYVNLLVNSGNVSYVLHSDYADNFFHLIAGEKTWLISSSTFRDSMYFGQNTQSADMSPVMPDSVDLVKFPKVSEVDFHEVSLKAGDILYIPADWPHYVRSKGVPNMAMNIWFGWQDYGRAAPQKLTCRNQLKTAATLYKARDIAEEKGNTANVNNFP